MLMKKKQDQKPKPVRIISKRVTAAGTIQYLVEFQGDHPSIWLAMKDVDLHLVEMYEYSRHMEHLLNKDQQKAVELSKKEAELSSFIRDNILKINKAAGNEKDRSRSKERRKLKKKTLIIKSESESEEEQQNLYIIDDDRDIHFMGSFNKGDKLEKILNASFQAKIKKWRFLVSWKVRPNGFKPKSSWQWQEALFKFSQPMLYEYLLTQNQLQMYETIEKESIEWNQRQQLENQIVLL